MLVVTTPPVEGTPIKRYIGMVSGETFAGVNVFKAVVGVKVDYFTAGSDNGMLAAIATGTAVIL